jgi:hypothetical protein
VTKIQDRIRVLAELALTEKCRSCGAEPGRPCSDLRPTATPEIDIHVVRAIQAIDREEVLS